MGPRMTAFGRKRTFANGCFRPEADIRGKRKAGVFLQRQRRHDRSSERRSQSGVTATRYNSITAKYWTRSQAASRPTPTINRRLCFA